MENSTGDKMSKKVLRDEYTFLGRLRRALNTYFEYTWIDGYVFTKLERKNRAIGNFKDMPSCSCPELCTIHI